MTSAHWQDRPPIYAEQYRSHVIRVIGKDDFGPVVSISKVLRTKIGERVVGCTTSVERARKIVDGWQDEGSP